MRDHLLRLQMQFFNSEWEEHRGEKQDNKRLFTQDDVDKIVQNRLKREEQKLQKALLKKIEKFIKTQANSPEK